MNSILEASILFIGCIGYLLYFYILKNSNIQNQFRQLFPKPKSSFYWVLLSRLIAFICMALLPIIYTICLGIIFWDANFTWTYTDTKYTLILALVLIPLGAFNAKGKEHLAMYPQARMDHWNPIEYVSNIFSWGIYLLGYEYLFRGILFLGLLPFVGLYPALVINTILYALVHLYKGKKETLGSIPLGIVLCLITAQTETIWTAFAAHWIMATNNFIWSQHFTKSA
ncbi:MAG: CPBP family intramembrane metalloprotease [Flavobacteriales bacterium]